MKLAYLTSLYPGLSSTFIVNEARGLRARGFDIRFFSVRRPDPASLPEGLRAEMREVTYLLDAGVVGTLAAVASATVRRPLAFLRTLGWSVTRPNLAWKRRAFMVIYFVEALILARGLRKGGFRHLHVHHANNANVVALLAARYLGRRYSVTAHGSDILLERELLREKIGGASFAVTVSEHNRRVLDDLGTSTAVHVVPTGVDVERFADEAESPQRTEPVRLVAVGRLNPVKGFDVLVEACRRLRERGLDFTCTIHGAGDEDTALAEAAEAADVTDRVHLAGPIAPSRVHEAYREGDIYVLSSRSEGLPVVVMEAMASGLPVVASDVTGVPELVVDGETGLLVPPEDPDALADALATLIEDPTRRDRMGEAGVQRVRDGFDADDHLDRLAALFAREIGGAGDRSASVATPAEAG